MLVDFVYIYMLRTEKVATSAKLVRKMCPEMVTFSVQNIYKIRKLRAAIFPYFITFANQTLQFYSF